jgi:carbamoyltransferase
MFIGITGYNHESSAALVNKDGELIDYCREESLSRIKGDKSFPRRSINKIIETNKLKKEDISRIAFYERPLSAFLHTIKVAAMYMPKSLNLLTHQVRNFNRSSVTCYLDIAREFKGLEEKLIYADHHLSHTLSSLVYSPIKNDICSIVVDGFGDRSSASISSVISPTEIRELWTCEYPISLGLFYSSITDFLGFAINEGEYKVMGLSAFGNSESDLAKSVHKLMFWDKSKNNLISDMSFFDYHISTSNSYSKKLVDLLGPARNPFISLYPEDKDFQRCADIARGAQDLTIKLLCNIFEYAHNLTNARKFLFSGGVAMNSASIDKISQLPFVDEIIIPPSPGDAGAAIGAAYYSYIKSNNSGELKFVKPSLFPTSINNTDQESLAKKILNTEFNILESNKDDSLSMAATLIKNGEVIGTLVSDSETGPRALGHRSLVCDGKNHEAVKKLNTVIKNRSPFRPTAPAMQLDVAKKYYRIRSELIDCYQAMTATCDCIEESGSLKFPTTHVDGTARIQIVEDGSYLDQLLKKLVPLEVEIIANSSLNVSGDPTCHDLIDGLLVCTRTPLKYLLTDFGLLEKK